MTLTPLDQNDPRLRQVCALLEPRGLRDMQQQLEIEALLDFVYGAVNKTTTSAQRDRSRPSTVGLSASQVGIMKQFCAVDLAVGRRGYSDIQILVNPRIVWRSKSQIVRPEGCVNFPTTWGITRRSRSVRVEALDRSGNEITLKLVGWPAVLLQHEIDHLNGHLFIDHIVDPTHAHLVKPGQFSEYRRNRAKWEHFTDVSADVVPAGDDVE